MSKLLGVGLLSMTLAFLVVAGQAAEKREAKLTDAEMHDLFIGKWLIEINDKGTSIKVSLNNKKDGTFEFELKNENEKAKANSTGTWKIEKGIILQTIKTGNDPKAG